MILPVYASRRGKLGNAYCFVLVCYVVWLLFGEAEGLECYSCHYENNMAVCTEARVTCQWGETCFNVVYRRPLLGIVYSKGCNSRSDCHSVQNLNNKRGCETTPSECLYCCDQDLCNDAERLMTSYFVYVPVVIATFSTLMRHQ